LRPNHWEIEAGWAKGEFIRHARPDTADLSRRLAGHLTIQLCDRHVEREPGELVVVSRRGRALPKATDETNLVLIEPTGTADETNLVLIEPTGTANTGNAGRERAGG
jgi:hypothetical protein